MIIPERHLGNTRSGKNICAYETKSQGYIRSQTIGFNKHDHFDAFCLFEFFTLKAVRQYGEFSDEAEQMNFMSSYHDRSAGDEFIVNEKRSLSIITSIDIRNHGESLVKHILRE